MTQLLGLTGLKRSGKDTAALRLMNRHSFVRVAFADPVKQALADLNPYVVPPTKDHRVTQLYDEIGHLEQRLVQAFERNTVAAINASHVASAVRTLDPMLAGDQRISEVLESVSGDWDRLKEGSDDVAPEVAAEIRRLQQILGTELGRSMVSHSIWVDTAMSIVEKLKHHGTSVVISDCRFDNEAQAIKDAGGTVIRIDRPSLNGSSTDSHASEQGVDETLIDQVIVNDAGIFDLHEAIDDVVAKVRT